MYNLFQLKLKSLLKDRRRIFFIFLLPLFLTTLMNVVFPNYSAGNEFDPISIGIAYNEDNGRDTIFESALKEAKGSNHKTLFKVIDCTVSEANDLLRDNVIVGYVVPSEQMKLVVKNSGAEETVIKTFLDSYNQKTATTILQTNLYSNLLQGTEFISDISRVDKQIRGGAIYFFLVFAMACLLGSLWGVKEITSIQPYLSQRGIQFCITPTPKEKILTCNLGAVLAVQFSMMCLILVYFSSVLKVYIGDYFMELSCICLMGSIVGISLGTMVGVVLKLNENIKNSILILGCMGLCVLSRLEITNQITLLRVINPASLIVDSIYSLYFYGVQARFYLEMGILAIMSMLFLVITYWCTRRQRYDYI